MIISHSWFRLLLHVQSWSRAWLTIIINDASFAWIMHLSIILRNNCAKDAGAARWESETLLARSYIYMNENEAAWLKLTGPPDVSRQQENGWPDWHPVGYIMQDLNSSQFVIRNDRTYLSRGEERRLWSFCISHLQEEKHWCESNGLWQIKTEAFDSFSCVTAVKKKVIFLWENVNAAGWM